MLARLGAIAVVTMLLGGCQDGGGRSAASSASASAGKGQQSAAESWQLPPGGIVRDRKAAVSIARAVWFSSTGIDPSGSSDEVWQNGTDAKLEGDVWVVETKSEPNTFSDGVRVLVSKMDGRILGIYAWQ